jgi:serine-aspartate repeat-containing protein C/D/E
MRTTAAFARPRAALETLESRRLLASIAGNVFNDANNNLVKDTGEANLAGRTVYVDVNNSRTPDAAEPGATTDASGNYKISNLPAGHHLVRQVLPAGWSQTTPTRGYANHVDVTATQAVTGRNFGARSIVVDPKTASIAGVAFEDSDADGVRDAGEADLLYFHVYVDRDNDKQFDGGEPWADQFGDGRYRFSNLAAGTYRLRLWFDEDWTQTLPAANATMQVTVSAGQKVTGKNFGGREVSALNTASVGGTIFNDGNGNGVKDAGEAGLPGRWVYADKNGDQIWDELREQIAETDGAGVYRISDLAAGSYVIRQRAYSGWAGTNPGGGGLAVTLVNRQNVTGKHFGSRKLPSAARSISGKVFGDKDKNGMLDADETGRADVLVYLDIDRSSSLDPQEPSTRTDSAGNYTFTGLSADTYSVRASILYGGADYFSYPGNSTATLAVSVVAGNATGQNFGIRRRGISGRVWVDTDNDNVRDPGETAPSGWRVFRDNNRNGAWDTGEWGTLTDADGFYSFSPGLSPYVYTARITVVKQPGHTLIAPTAGYYDVTAFLVWTTVTFNTAGTNFRFA